MTDIKHKNEQTASIHTPGTWQPYSDYEPFLIVGNIDGPDDGQMHYTRVCEVEENAWSEANARLIAAAPEFLSNAEKRVEQAERFLAGLHPASRLVPLQLL